MGGSQVEARGRGDAREMIGHPIADPLGGLTALLTALLQHHRAGVDADRTGQRAQTVSRTGVQTLVLIGFVNGLQLLAIVAGGLQARHFPQAGDTLAR